MDLKKFEELGSRVISDFQVAYGTMVGTEHLRLKKNNQDAFCVSEGLIGGKFARVGVVCDGCGSQQSSEVGSKLAAPLLAHYIMDCTTYARGDVERGLRLAEENLLGDLRKLSHNMYSANTGWNGTVSQTFLFTIIGFIITPEKTWIFSLGDGVYCINNDLHVKEYEGNAPPYLGYRLIDSKYDHLRLTIDECIPTDEVQSLLIGSDGAAQLAELENKNIPGKDQLVGPLNQFWEEDKYFKNPDMIRRKLFLINRETVRPNWETKTLARHPGLLEDDTTLIVVRRTPNE